MRTTWFLFTTLAIALATTLSSCDTFTLSELYYTSSDLPLGIQPALAAARPSETIEFAGTGGAAGYRYKVIEPGGGTIDPDSGTYEAPSSDGEFTVEVSDRAGDVSRAIVYVVIPKALTISPTTASVQSSESKQFAASGGEAPYSFALNSTDGIGTIDSGTGLFAADTSNVGSGIVTLTDASGAAVSASVYVSDNTTLFLAPEANPLQQGQQIDLFPSGGTSPYFLTLLAGGTVWHYDDPATGDGTVMGPPANRYTAPDSIGTVTVRVTDNVDATFDLELTVLPATPGNFDASGDTGSTQTIELSWSYATPGIDNFRIERSTDGGAFTEIATPAAGTTLFTDAGRLPNTLYEYRLYAVAGSYESAPTPSKLAVSNP